MYSVTMNNNEAIKFAGKEYHDKKCKVIYTTSVSHRLGLKNHTFVAMLMPEEKNYQPSEWNFFYPF